MPNRITGTNPSNAPDRADRWLSFGSPKDLPDFGLEPGLGAGLNLDISQKPEKGADYHGRSISSLDFNSPKPSLKVEGKELSIDAAPIRSVDKQFRLRHEDLQKDLDYKYHYEQRYQDTIESLDPNKARRAVPPMIIDKKPDVQIKPVKPLPSEPALEPVKKDVSPPDIIRNEPDAPMKSAKPLPLEPPLEPIKKEAKSDDKSEGAKSYSVSNLIKWFTNLFKSGAKNTESGSSNGAKAGSAMSGTPKLEPPEQAKMEEMLKLIEKMNRDMDRMREINHEMDGLLTTDDAKADAYLRHQFIQRLKEHVHLKEKESVATADRIFEMHENIKESQSRALELQKDIQKREKANKLLGWIDTASSVLVVTVGVASAGLFIASFFTAGATAPLATAALAVAGGIGGIAKGAVTIQKAVSDDKTKKQQAELLGISEQRERCQTMIEQGMREWREDLAVIASSWGVLREYIAKRNETFSLMK